MNVLSLFDGISCGQIALERAEIKVDTYYASEIKEDAIKVTQHNYPNTIQLGNVEKVKSNELPKIDLLIGGSPCQNFSIACSVHKRKGLQGEKSKLFYEYLRLLKEVNPKYFLFENVGSMKQGEQDIISNLLGVQPININSKLVSGQLRNRLYWTNIPNISALEDKNIKLNEILECGYSDREKARCLLESDSRPGTTPVKMFHRYYAIGFVTLIFKNKKHYEDCVVHYNTYLKGLSAKGIDSFNGDLSVYEGVRYLNQNELEQLQTLPVDYTKILSRNQAAGVIGDGWTVDIIVHILSHIPKE
jgi:DNA (cytosine-5)-methyltransferase 3A